jgi:hypothetical protein
MRMTATSCARSAFFSVTARVWRISSMTESGVRRYTKATVEIFFPNEKVCCDLCPLMETYARKQCRRTGEYLLDTRVVGYDCPLKFTEEE